MGLKYGPNPKFREASLRKEHKEVAASHFWLSPRVKPRNKGGATKLEGALAYRGDATYGGGHYTWRRRLALGPTKVISKGRLGQNPRSKGVD